MLARGRLCAEIIQRAPLRNMRQARAALCVAHREWGQSCTEAPCPWEENTFHCPPGFQSPMARGEQQRASQQPPNYAFHTAARWRAAFYLPPSSHNFCRVIARSQPPFSPQWGLKGRVGLSGACVCVRAQRGGKYFWMCSHLWNCLLGLESCVKLHSDPVVLWAKCSDSANVFMFAGMLSCHVLACLYLVLSACDTWF